MRKVISELCGVNERSYYIWKNKTHPKLINLLELYFSEEDIKEFLDTNKIAKMEILNYYQFELEEDFESFFFNMENVRIEFLFSFLYLFKDKLLEKDESSSASFFDYYLYDLLETFKIEYKLKAKELLGIEDFEEQIKELHIYLMKIKFPIYKYLIYNLRYDFKPFISLFSHSQSINKQNIVLMMPFLKNMDLKNLTQFKNIPYFQEENFLKSKSLIKEIIETDNDISKINKLLKNKTLI